MLASLNDLGDDPEKFFRRSPFDVGAGDLWRWHAARVALRELTQSTPKRDTNDGG